MSGASPSRLRQFCPTLGATLSRGRSVGLELLLQFLVDPMNSRAIMGFLLDCTQGTLSFDTKTNDGWQRVLTRL